MSDIHELPPELHEIDERLRRARRYADQTVLRRIEARVLGRPRGRRPETAGPSARRLGGRRGSLVVLLAATMLLVSTGAAMGLGGLFIVGPRTSLHVRGHHAKHLLFVSGIRPLGKGTSNVVPHAASTVPGVQNQAPVTSGDTFIIGPTSTSTSQTINNTQVASQGGFGGGVTIISNSTYSPTISQCATNVNINGNAVVPVYGGPCFARSNG